MKHMKKIGFIGLGLIGGSIAKAVRTYFPETEIIAYSRSSRTTEYAFNEGIIDRICREVDSDFSDCDYIFLCAPVEANVLYLDKLKSLISPDCILTDVGSTKCDIHNQIIEHGLEAQFIGGHPMAGSEKTGIENSRFRLIENAYYIVTPTDKVPRERVLEYVHLVTSLKALPLVLDYKEHDYVTGAISHLPHIIAAALVNLVHDKDTPAGTMRMIASGGFKDITRIASSSPEMWEQICATTADNLPTLLGDYIDSLTRIRAELSHGTSGTIFQLFEDSRDYRNTFSDLSSGPIKKVYRLYCDLADETGSIAVLSTILVSNSISIKDIVIVNNR